MAENQYYAINTDVKFAPLSLIDVDRLRAEASDRWFNRTLCRVNDAVELRAHRGLTVPRGVLHRTRAPERTAVLMIESASIVPTGD